MKVRIAQFAKALGMTPTTVNILIVAGLVPYTRTKGGHRRFNLEDVVSVRRELAQRLEDFPSKLDQQEDDEDTAD